MITLSDKLENGRQISYREWSSNSGEVYLQTAASNGARMVVEKYPMKANIDTVSLFYPNHH